MSQHITPVLVVGAGAAGSMLALELARRGIQHRVVDRLPQASSYSRAVTVHARTLEILERIDPQLVQRYLDLGIHCPGYVMHFVGQDGQRREVRPGLDFTRLQSRYPFLLLNAQNDTEALLQQYLKEKFNQAPEWGVSCGQLQLHDDSVTAELQHADGRSEQARFRYVVACDGAGSRIRQQLDLQQEGSDYASTVLQNLDVEIDGFPDDAQIAHYCMGPGHFVMVVKLPRGFFRLLMSQPADKADAEATPQQVFSEILAQHFDGLRFGKTHWHSRWQSHVRLAQHYRKGNVFLAGDAAHVHSTAGGQGMNCCMQDAYNLAWKLAFVLQGKAAPALLDSYENERKPIGAQVIAAASEIHELFMAGRNSTPDEVVALQRSGAMSSLVGKVSGLAYHYRPAAAAASALPQAGDRAPDARVPGHPERWLYDHTRHTGFTLLVAVPAAEDTAAANAARQSMERIAAPHAALVHAVLLAPAPAAYADAGSGPQLYLIRPDGYVALRAPLADASRIQQWLQQFAAA